MPANWENSAVATGLEKVCFHSNLKGNAKECSNDRTIVLISCASNFPGGSDGKASVYNAGDPGSSPGLGRFPGEGNGNPSSTIAWKIPWTEEPGRLQSMESQKVGHN